MEELSELGRVLDSLSWACQIPTLNMDGRWNPKLRILPHAAGMLCYAHSFDQPQETAGGLSSIPSQYLVLHMQGLIGSWLYHNIAILTADHLILNSRQIVVLLLVK